MSRKTNLVKLGDVLQQFLSQEKLDIKISQNVVRNSWSEIAGEMVARRTTNIQFQNKTLLVTIDSAALKHELSYQTEALITNVNKFCGYRLIDSLVIR